MGGQLQGSLPFIERTTSARYTYVLLMVVITTILLWTSWNDAARSASLLHQRMFLTAAALVFAVSAVTLALVPWWETARTWLIPAHLVIMGLYVGLAIATTDWSSREMRGWWQFWWTPWLVAGQVQQVLKLSRSGVSSVARGTVMPQRTTN